MKKLTNSETTIFVYDAFGKSIAEYANQAPQNPQVAYLTADHLGSPRIITNQDGSVVSRHDYHPFGTDASAPERTPDLGYRTDPVRPTFTGYEKDSETDLEFAQARYYSKSLGRFYSVDPFGGSAKKRDPQSMNRYAYVNNNPLNLTDPSGMSAAPGCGHVDEPPCMTTDGKPEFFVEVNAEHKHKSLFRKAWNWVTNQISPRTHAQTIEPEEPAEREPPTKEEREELLKSEGFESRPEPVRLPPMNNREKEFLYRQLFPLVPEDQVPCFADDPEPTAEMSNPNAPEPAEQMGPPSPALSASQIIDNIFNNPQSLTGQTPGGLLKTLGQLPSNWREETLGRGSQAGNGLLLREYAPSGRPTGRFVSWHPGGGHHGANPYWKVTSGVTGIHRVF